MCFTSAGSATGCIVPARENESGVCGDGIDNDCDGSVDGVDPECGAKLIQGFVTLSTSQGVLAATGATVVLDGYRQTTQLTAVGQGAAQAYYLFDQTNIIAPGRRLVAASLFGYSTKTMELTVVPGGSYTIDFTLEPRLCNDNCTNRDGFCDSSCIGVGLCQPSAEEKRTMLACHPAGAPFGLKPGQEVTLSYDPARVGQEAEVGICCSSVPVFRPAPKTIVANNPVFGTIDTLVKYTTTVVINGRPYQFVVSTW